MSGPSQYGFDSSLADQYAAPPKTSAWPPAVILASVTVFIFIVLILNYFLLINQPPSIRGTVGDLFGASNALFSGLAVALVIYAIFIQRQEIKIAKSELAITRNIMKEQEKSLCAQNLQNYQMIFENTFFKILELLRHYRNDLEQKVSRNLHHENATAHTIANAFLLKCSEANIPYEQMSQFFRMLNMTDEITHAAKEDWEQLGVADYIPFIQTTFRAIDLIRSSNIPNPDFYYALLNDFIMEEEVILFHMYYVTQAHQDVKELIRDKIILHIVDGNIKDAKQYFYQDKYL